MLRGGWGLRRQAQPQPQPQPQSPPQPPQPVAANANANGNAASADPNPRTPPRPQQFSDHSFAIDDDAPVYFSQNEMADFSPGLQNLIEEQNQHADMIYEEDSTSGSTGSRHRRHIRGGGKRGGPEQGIGLEGQGYGQPSWLKCLDEKENSRDDKPSPLGQDDSRRAFGSLDGSRRSSLEEVRTGILPLPGSPRRSSPSKQSSSPASKTLVQKDGNTTPREGNNTTPRDAKSPSKQIYPALPNDTESSNEDNYGLSLVDSEDYETSLIYSQSFSFDPVHVKEATSVEVRWSGSAASSAKSSPERLGAVPRDALVVEGGQDSSEEDTSEPSLAKSKSKPVSLDRIPLKEDSLVGESDSGISGGMRSSPARSGALPRIPFKEVSSVEEKDTGISQSMRSSPERSGALPRIPFNEVSSVEESGSSISRNMTSSPDRSGALPRIPFNDVLSVEESGSSISRNMTSSPARSGALPRDTISERGPGQEMYTQAESGDSDDMYEPNLVKATTFSFEDIHSHGSEDSPMDLIEKLRSRSDLVDDIPLSTRSEESNELLSKPSLQLSASSVASSPSSSVNGTMHLRQERIMMDGTKEDKSACVESFHEQEAREELEYQEQEAREELEYRENSAQQEDGYFSPTSSYARTGLDDGPRFSDSGDITTSSSNRHLAFVESEDSLLEELKLKHELASRLQKAAECSLMDADEESEEETEEDARELQYLYEENTNEAACDTSGDSDYLEDIQVSADRHAMNPYTDGNSQLAMDATEVVGIDAHVYPNFLEDIPESQEEHELEEENDADSHSSALEEWNFEHGNGDLPSNSGEAVVGAHRSAVDELLLESAGTLESLVGIDYVTNGPIDGASQIAEPVLEAGAGLAPCVHDIAENREAIAENTPGPALKPRVKLASTLVDCSDEHKTAIDDTVISPSEPKAKAVLYQTKTETEERARFVAKSAANVESARVHVAVEDKLELEGTTEDVVKPTVRDISKLDNVPDQSKTECEERARVVAKSAANVESSHVPVTVEGKVNVAVEDKVNVAVEDKVELEDTAESAKPTERYTSYLANLPDKFMVETEDSAAAAVEPTTKPFSSRVDDPIEHKVDITSPAKPTVRNTSYQANVPVERGPEAKGSSGFVAKVPFEETPELLAKPTTNIESSGASGSVKFENTTESEAKAIEETTEPLPTSAQVKCSSDECVAKPVPTETKEELETMSEPATTLEVKVAASTVKEEDPFEWAYAVWRRRGLMNERVTPSDVNVEKSWRKTACQIVVPSSHEELETIITPRVSYVGSLTPQGVVDNIPSDEKRDRESFYLTSASKMTPVTSSSKMTKSGGKGFANVMQKWREKSDGKPNTHFLSPESSTPTAREGDLPETTNMFNTESPRLANDTPVEKSFEPASATTFEESEPLAGPVENSVKPVSPAILEKTEPRADFHALNEARADSCENFYFKAIKYHEKPSSKTADNGKKDLMKRQSLEISRPRFEGKESTRRQSYSGNQQTRQDAKRPSFETPLVNSNKGPTTQASKIKAAYNKQRLSIERQSVDQATNSQSESKQHLSNAQDDKPTKSQHESDFQRHKSPPRSRGDFKTAIQTALREGVPDLKPKGDPPSFPPQSGHQVDAQQPVLLSFGAQPQSKKHSEVQDSSGLAKSAIHGAGPPRGGIVPLIKKESRSSVDIYGYNPIQKTAAAVPMRDLVILEEEEDSEYDFDGNRQKRDVPRTVEMATDEMGIPMASSADDESIDERIPKLKSSAKLSAIRPSLNQEGQDYSPWTKKLVANVDEELEDDQRITPREEAFSERPWRHDMVIGRVKSFSERASQPPTEVDERSECHCSNSLFSGNDKLVDFFLPLMGMACSCGKRQQHLVNPEEPTALENILRPWQVDFLAAFGICRGDQLVKAQHRSGKALATALRQYRRKQDMAPFRTKSCAMAIQIWAKTGKAFVRSIRQQLLTGTSELKLPNTLYILSSFLEKMPGEIDGTDTSCSTHSNVSISREVDEADFL